MGGMPCCSAWARSPGSWRRCRMPPNTLGCSVLTRPPNTSGKPVRSSTAVTSAPCSSKNFWVPPVEYSCTPRRRRVETSGASRSLWYTDSRAARMSWSGILNGATKRGKMKA
uniref:Uncharacterized protein n=1 Tax=Tanacetum cinerariifolium TaxID=118510 RepID=A0A699WBE4_TANCI|nr:hypothetical protein [Tanacetum cinerariifolium]